LFFFREKNCFNFFIVAAADDKELFESLLLRTKTTFAEPASIDDVNNYHVITALDCHCYLSS
jgi:hypothetical protein